MISYGFIVLAAFFNACMDVFENSPNFNESIFSHLNKKFWCKDVSCNYAKKIGGYKLDSWHISKSLMIISACSAAWASYYFEMPLGLKEFNSLLNYIIIVGSYGITWICFFIAIYHSVFKVN